MNIQDYIIIFESAIILFILGYNWKTLLSYVWKDKFYEIEIVQQSGIITPKLHYVKDPSKYSYRKNTYYTLKTSYMKNGHKYYMFIDGNPYHIDLLSNKFEQNIEFDAMRKEVDYAALFKEKANIVMDLMKMALPFIVGVGMGILIQTVANTQ